MDEKTFYERLELLKDKSNSKITVYIDQSFYEKAKNYLESLEDVQEQKRHGTEIELSKHDINTIIKTKALGFEGWQDYNKRQQDSSTKE